MRVRHKRLEPEIKPQPVESQLPRTRDPIRSWGREWAGKDFGFHVGNSFELARHRNNMASQVAMCVSFNLFCEHVGLLFSGSRVRPDCPAMIPEFVAMSAQAQLQNPSRNRRLWNLALRSQPCKIWRNYTECCPRLMRMRFWSLPSSRQSMPTAHPLPDSGSPAKLETWDRPAMVFFFKQDMGVRHPCVCLQSSPVPGQVSGCEREWFGGHGWREVGRLQR